MDKKVECGGGIWKPGQAMKRAYGKKKVGQGGGILKTEQDMKEVYR